MYVMGMGAFHIESSPSCDYELGDLLDDDLAWPMKIFIKNLSSDYAEFRRMYCEEPLWEVLDYAAVAQASHVISERVSELKHGRTN